MMVYFDLSSRSMLIKDIVEDEVALWTKGSISWLSINRGSYQDNRVNIVGDAFRPFVGIGGESSGLAYF